MSKNLDQAFVDQFDAEVKQAYQGSSKLRDCVRTKMNVEGETYSFQKIGKGIGHKRGPSHSDVTPMNVAHEQPTATLKDYEFPEYTDIFDDAKTKIDERQELAETIGNAMGRRDDQIIIDDALDGASGLDTVAKGDLTGDVMNKARLNAAAKELNKHEIPMEDRFMVTTVSAVEQMLNDDKLTSSDYNTVQALVNGEVDYFMGFEFKFIGNRDEGGLPGTGTSTAKHYAFHRQAIGLAVGLERTEVEYIGEKTSWLTNGQYSGGAVDIDDEGIIEVETDDTA